MRSPMLCNPPSPCSMHMFIESSHEPLSIQSHLHLTEGSLSTCLSTLLLPRDP
jgi:hypothetical protein